MNCPRCGAENPADARFCMACGTALTGEEPPPPVEQPAPEAEAPPTAPMGIPEATGEEILPVEEAAPLPPLPPRPGGGGAGALTAGWSAALLRGVVAFVILALLGELIAVLLFANTGLPSAQMAKAGGIVFYAFHHVGLEADFPPFDFSRIFGALGEGQAPPEIPGLGPTGPIDFSFTVALALMLATALLAWLFYRGGRAVATHAGGPPSARALHGLKVAVPYALLAFGLSFLVSFEVPVPAGVPFLVGGGELTVGISPIAALLWPLGLGVVFGALGGLSTARSEIAGERRGRLGLAVVGGGLRMAWYGLALSFVGLLVHAAVSPDVTRAYFDAVIEAGPRGGSAQVLFTALEVPNMATLVLVPAMGGSIAASGGGTTVTLLSYTDFPTSFDLGAVSPLAGGLTGTPALPIEFGTAPVGYFLFLLVPLAATVLAGAGASRRYGGSRGEGMMIGAGSGVVFAVAVVGLSILAGLTLKVGTSLASFSQTTQSFVGPHLPLAAGVSLAWGVLGGVLGGALWARKGVTPPAGPSADAGSSGFEVEPPPPRPEMQGGPAGPVG